MAFVLAVDATKAKCSLKFTNLKAKDLRAADLTGKSDPFLAFMVAPFFSCV